ETRTPSLGTTDWDILIIDDGEYRVLEVKSGAIGRKDRRNFWLRIRKEIFQAKQKGYQFYPGLVINLDNKPNAFKAWSDLSERTDFDKFKQLTVPQKAPKRVENEKQLIKEA